MEIMFQYGDLSCREVLSARYSSNCCCWFFSADIRPLPKISPAGNRVLRVLDWVWGKHLQVHNPDMKFQLYEIKCGAYRFKQMACHNGRKLRSVDAVKVFGHDMHMLDHLPSSLLFTRRGYRPQYASNVSCFNPRSFQVYLRARTTY